MWVEGWAAGHLCECVHCICMHMCVPSGFVLNALVCDHNVYVLVKVSSCKCFPPFTFWMC